MRPTLTAFLLLVCTRLFSQSPDWIPLPTPSSGTILGQVTMDGFPCDQEDLIGAFSIDGLCVGLTQPILDGTASFLTLTVCGDDATTPEMDGLNRCCYYAALMAS